MYRAAKSKNAVRAILIRTHDDTKLLFETPLPESLIMVDAPAFQIRQKMSEIVAIRPDPIRLTKRSTQPRQKTRAVELLSLERERTTMQFDRIEIANFRSIVDPNSFV